MNEGGALTIFNIALRGDSALIWDKAQSFSAPPVHYSLFYTNDTAMTANIASTCEHLLLLLHLSIWSIRFVLTAAHCIASLLKNQSSSSPVLLLGTNDLADPNAPRFVRHVVIFQSWNFIAHFQVKWILMN